MSFLLRYPNRIEPAAFTPHCVMCLCFLLCPLVPRDVTFGAWSVVRSVAAQSCHPTVTGESGGWPHGLAGRFLLARHSSKTASDFCSNG